MTGREAVLYVARKHPDWMERVVACCEAQQSKEPDTPISAWDVGHVLQQPTRPLGPLVKWGILDHVGDATRRGHRRYYLVREGVCEAVREVRP